MIFEDTASAVAETLIYGKPTELGGRAVFHGATLEISHAVSYVFNSSP
jgi:hypothetical protein